MFKEQFVDCSHLHPPTGPGGASCWGEKKRSRRRQRMTCGSPESSLSTSGYGLNCSTEEAGHGLVAVVPGNLTDAEHTRNGEMDGIRMVVLSACALAFLLFLYIFWQYVRQRRSEPQPQDTEGQRMIELPRKWVTMYEAMSEDSDDDDDKDAGPSDSPVLVVNVGSVSEPQRRAVAVGIPENSA